MTKWVLVYLIFYLSVFFLQEYNFCGFLLSFLCPSPRLFRNVVETKGVLGWKPLQSQRCWISFPVDWLMNLRVKTHLKRKLCSRFLVHSSKNLYIPFVVDVCNTCKRWLSYMIQDFVPILFYGYVYRN